MNTVTTKEAVIIKTDAPLAAREQEEQDALTKVKAWTVATAEDYSALDAFLVTIGQLKKKIEEDFADSKGKAYDAWKAIVAQEKGHLDGMDEARKIGKAKLNAYEEEQRRIEEKRQAEADALAKKAAEDAALAAATAAEASGDHAKAEAILTETPIPVAAPKIESAIPKRATSSSVRWSATVGGMNTDGTKTDPLFVLKAVRTALTFMEKAKTDAAKAATEDLRQAEKDLAFMEYNMIALNGQAKAGSPYVNGVLKLGGVAFNSRKV